MWYLFECSDGWCVIHVKNVLRAGRDIVIGDICTFFYQGKKYEGKVLEMNEDHDKMNEELSKLKKKLMKEAHGPSASEVLPAKRRIQPVNFYGKSTCDSNKRKKKDNPLKMTEEEAKRQHILKLNQKEAKRRADHDILAKAKKDSAQKDPDWNPNAEDEDESQDSVISDVLAHGIAMKDDRSSLMKAIKNTPSLVSGPPQSSSPTKEELKRRNEILQMKLQMAYDTINNAENEGKPESSTSAKDKRKSVSETQHHDLEDTSEFISGHQSSERQKALPQMKSATVTSEKSESSLEDQPDPSSNLDDFDFNTHNQSAEGERSFPRKESGQNQLSGTLSDVSCDLNQYSEPTYNGNDSKSSDVNSNMIDDLDMSRDGDDFLKYQLYGPRKDTTELGRSIYCKTDVLTKALTNASTINHLIRRLMLGVFIPSQVLDCTVTGQSWHAGGVERAKEEKKPLHQEALRVIVDFSNSIAKKKKWHSKNLKFEKAKPILSGRLIEIKKHFKEGKLKD